LAQRRNAPLAAATPRGELASAIARSTAWAFSSMRPSVWRRMILAAASSERTGSSGCILRCTGCSGAFLAIVFLYTPWGKSPGQTGPGAPRSGPPRRLVTGDRADHRDQRQPNINADFVRDEHGHQHRAGGVHQENRDLPFGVERDGARAQQRVGARRDDADD